MVSIVRAKTATHPSIPPELQDDVDQHTYAMTPENTATVERLAAEDPDAYRVYRAAVNDALARTARMREYTANRTASPLPKMDTAQDIQRDVDLHTYSMQPEKEASIRRLAEEDPNAYRGYRIVVHAERMRARAKETAATVSAPPKLDTEQDILHDVDLHTYSMQPEKEASIRRLAEENPDAYRLYRTIDHSARVRARDAATAETVSAPPKLDTAQDIQRDVDLHTYSMPPDKAARIQRLATEDPDAYRAYRGSK